MGIFETGKSIVETLQKYKDPALVNQMLQYQGQVLELENEKRELLDRIKELEEALETKGKLTHDPPLYYLEDDPTPFCPRCWEADRKLIHLVFPGGLEDKDCKCPACKWTAIGVKEREEGPGFPVSSLVKKIPR